MGSLTEKERTMPSGAISTDDIERRERELAGSFDCMTATDFQLLTGITASTAEAWRRRGKGPAYILVGTAHLYPLDAVREFLQANRREIINAVISASPGGLGGVRSQTALKMVLDKLGVTVIPQSFALGAAHQAFDSEGALVDDKAAQLVRSVGSSLARAASAYTAPAGNKQLAAA
jgi:hypothetical protein